MINKMKTLKLKIKLYKILINIRIIKELILYKLILNQLLILNKQNVNANY